VDYLNAHGTGTDMNDRIETRVIRDVFGANDLPVSSTKAVTGHLLGAAGALEAVITILAMGANIAPPTINWSTRDPECDLDYIPNDARQLDITPWDSAGTTHRSYSRRTRVRLSSPGNRIR
jgi:3-oxoacyl-[acyl-carrier-protein] synthase II